MGGKWWLWYLLIFFLRLLPFRKIRFIWIKKVDGWIARRMRFDIVLG